MRLICKLINGEELEFEISKPSFVIGRSNQADVVIPHEGMSRRHCSIENKNGQFYITDLESSNGVFIDEKRIPSNTMTPMPEYLNISFGAVQSLQIEQEENLNYKIEPVTKPFHYPGHKTNSDIKKSVSKTAAKHEHQKRTPAPSFSGGKNKLIYVIAILILLISGYFYLEDKKMQKAPLGPEEMYE